jgi:hypothetical protein
MPVEPEDRVAYTRGRLDGEVAAALSRHEDHFQRINGSLDKMAEVLNRQSTEFIAQLAVQSLAIQRLADLGDAREKTVKETAAALKVADDQRRDAANTRSRPITTTAMVVGTVVGVLTLVLGVVVYLVNRS